MRRKHLIRGEGQSMGTERDTMHGAANDSKGRRPYQVPAVRLLGKVRDLTRDNGSQGNLDPNTFVVGKSPA
jgi:hypothetical protein